VLISGEPGIGKSRLTAAFYERLAGEPHTRLRYFCAPHHQDSALYPFVAQLERAAGFEREDSAETRLDKLEALLAQSGDVSSETASLFADLLAVPAGGRYPALPADLQRKRELTLAALIGQLDALARQQPVLIAFEDAHWSDPTLLELLDRVVDDLRRLPVLLVITCRPEFAPPWVGQAHVASLALNRLGRRLLAAVARRSDGELRNALDQLTEAGLVFRRGTPPRATFLFKHALVQDAAYSTLLRGQRQALHAHIGSAPAERFPEIAETQPEIPAHHFTEARLAAEAIGYWRRAGERASAHSANREAVAHLTRGIEVLKTLAESPQRDEQELILQVSLAVPLMASKGWGNPDVESVVTRALELCRRVDNDSHERFRALFALGGLIRLAETYGSDRSSWSTASAWPNACKTRSFLATPTP
jgi:predicted ATPase